VRALSVDKLLLTPLGDQMFKVEVRVTENRCVGKKDSVGVGYGLAIFLRSVWIYPRLIEYQSFMAKSSKKARVAKG
jgi:hypothetical protein